MNRRDFIRSAIVSVGAALVPLKANSFEVVRWDERERPEFDTGKMRQEIGLEIKKQGQRYRNGVIYYDKNLRLRSRQILLNWADSL